MSEVKCKTISRNGKEVEAVKHPGDENWQVGD